MGNLEEFEGFSTRESFNKSLRHFNLVMEVIKEFESGFNLADVINAFLSNGKMTGSQIAPVLSALLVDKYKYYFSSFNMSLTVTELSPIADTVAKWTAADLVVSYYHPETGLLVLNPKNAAHWKQLDSLKKYEMVTVYSGGMKDNIKLKEKKEFSPLLKTVADKLSDILQGNKIKAPPVFLTGSFKIKKFSTGAVQESPKQVAGKRTSSVKKSGVSQSPSVSSGVQLVVSSAGTMRTASVAPQTAGQQTGIGAPPPVARGGRLNKIGPFGVVVTNELFHNGNVEAWKRIIFSYSSKYTTYQVQVYYDGEVIHDLNSLFKWGKVKHGTAILVAISGPDQQIQDVSKLRKYLSEGASPRFEQFLHGIPGKDLGLF